MASIYLDAVDECVVQTGPAVEACNVISHSAMEVLMPSSMFYCQITPPVQMIYSTTATPGGLIHLSNSQIAAAKFQKQKLCVGQVGHAVPLM